MAVTRFYRITDQAVAREKELRAKYDGLDVHLWSAEDRAEYLSPDKFVRDEWIDIPRD